MWLDLEKCFTTLVLTDNLMEEKILTLKFKSEIQRKNPVIYTVAQLTILDFTNLNLK